MSIIFDEEKHAKLILAKGKCLTTNKKYFELQLVANYLRSLNKEDKEIESTLHNIARKTFRFPGQGCKTGKVVFVSEKRK